MNRKLCFVLALLASVPIRAQEQATHDRGHEAGGDRRGDEGMGFSHDKVAHRFGLTRTGGFITAEVKDAADSASATDVRKHFGHIAAAFKRGDFDLPMFIHGGVPPGVPLMKKLKGEIDYEVHHTSLGGRIAITTAKPKPIYAMHPFLYLQTCANRTSEPTEVVPLLPVDPILLA